MFGDIQILNLIDKYSPASGGFVPETRSLSPRPEALDPVEA